MKEEKETPLVETLILKEILLLLLTENLQHQQILHNLSPSGQHTALYFPLYSASLWLMPAGGIHSIPAPCTEPI